MGSCSSQRVKYVRKDTLSHTVRHIEWSQCSDILVDLSSVAGPASITMAVFKTTVNS